MVVFDAKEKLIISRWSSTPYTRRFFYFNEEFESFISTLFIHKMNVKFEILDNVLTKVEYDYIDGSTHIHVFNCEKAYKISTSQLIQQFEWFKSLIDGGYINIWAGRVEEHDVSKIPKQPKYQIINQ